MAPGVGGSRIDFSGGTVQNYRRQVASVANGTLNISGGTVRSTSGQSGVVGNQGSIINVTGGQVQSDAGAGIVVSGDSTFTLTGGTVTALSAAGSGVVVSNLSGSAAQLRGGTVNNGVPATRNLPGTTAVQAALSGSITVNGGVFALGDAAIDIAGGSCGI